MESRVSMGDVGQHTTDDGRQMSEIECQMISVILCIVP
jgi:hypothetical protein